MVAQLIVGPIVEAPHGGFLERAVHPLDLAVGPRVARLGQAVVDVGLGAGQLEAVGAEKLAGGEGVADVLGGRLGVARRGEVRPVVGQHGVDVVGNGVD